MHRAPYMWAHMSYRYVRFEKETVHLQSAHNVILKLCTQRQKYAHWVQGARADSTGRRMLKKIGTGESSLVGNDRQLIISRDESEVY